MLVCLIGVNRRALPEHSVQYDRRVTHADQPSPQPDEGQADEPQPDVNALAIEGAGLPPDVAAWLRTVNDQVAPRLARLNPEWAQSSQPEVARACAFGLLLGYLAEEYPHVRPDLHWVAEGHPSFTTLRSGSRLAILRQLAVQPGRAVEWIGPLIGVDDPQRIRQLFD